MGNGQHNIDWKPGEHPPEVTAMQVIIVKHAIGKGTAADPIRMVEDFYTGDGCHLVRRELHRL